jgi:hypothetical protein
MHKTFERLVSSLDFIFESKFTETTLSFGISKRKFATLAHNFTITSDRGLFSCYDFFIPRLTTLKTTKEDVSSLDFIFEDLLLWSTKKTEKYRTEIMG